MCVFHRRLKPEVDRLRVYLGRGGPAVEGMRLKPDAILLQTDGHRKPPRSEPVAAELPPLEPLHCPVEVRTSSLPLTHTKQPGRGGGKTAPWG